MDYFADLDFECSGAGFGSLLNLDGRREAIGAMEGGEDLVVWGSRVAEVHDGMPFRA